jgi:lipoprotein-anchoring transpeptidase ErfK/SrfK
MSRKALALSAALLAGLLAVAAATTLDVPGNRAVAGPVLPASVKPLFALPRPAPKPRPAPGSFTVEHVQSGQVALHAKPGGPVIARVGPRTQFGSPQTLAVAARARGWVGVINEDVANGSVAWVQAHSLALKPKLTRVVLRVNLERKRLELVDGNREERQMTVGVGGPGSPTPKGRFSITDKLSGSAFGAAYGCCILALSGHQTNTPPGWTGGNRLAIHGTDNPGTIGRGASAGCLHADASDMKLLMRKVSLGTPVFIH